MALRARYAPLLTSRRDDFTDNDPELASYAVDDTDEDPDYLEEPAHGGTSAALAALNADFPESASEDEDDAEAELGAVNDNEMEMFHHDLKAAQGFKKGNRRIHGNRGSRRGFGGENYSFEVKSLMGEVNQAYAFGQLDRAFSLVSKVIQIEARVYSAWKIMGEIFKEKGEVHKCLLAWLTAAHAKPNDWELWLMCAKMSLDQYGPDRMNYRDQAIYCYNRTIRANPDNIDAIYDRSLLLKEMGQLDKAAEGFLVLHRLLPNDMAILREIATLFIELQRIPEAIEYYTKNVNFFKATGNQKSDFGWSELNILVELYMMNQQWEGAISTLKNTSRWLCGRVEEKYWEGVEDDREWDATDRRRRTIREFISARFEQEAYVLPLELRIKLGVCRMKTGNKAEAMQHFGYLDEVDSVEYFDLFQEAGDVLYDAKEYGAAVQYYSSVVEGNQYLDRKLWFNMAICYKALNQVDDAEDCYGTVLEAYPQDTGARMALASIYEVSDRKAEALELVNQVIALRKEKEKAIDPIPKDTAVVQHDPMAFFPNQPAPKRAKRTRPGALTAEQRMEMNARITEQTAIKYRKLEYLCTRMLAGEPEAVKDWLDTAGELVDDFRNTKALFPSDKGKSFKGFVSTAHRRQKAKDQQEQLEQMQHRLEETLTFQEDQIDPLEIDSTKFRGLDFDTWLNIFMQYALCLAKHDNYLDAYDVCSVAKEANVFYLDKRKIFIIWTTWLACAIHVHDPESCSTICRFFMITYQFQTEAYSLFVTALTMSRNGLEVFHNNANQKFLLRQIKVMDQSLDGVKRTNAASLTNIDGEGKEYKPKRMNPALLMLYGHILASGRSYISALNYYTRVYTMMPNDPMVLLSIGLAYLHRSMQRQGENRHLQALQAMAFMTEYYDQRTARKPVDEAAGSGDVGNGGKAGDADELEDEEMKHDELVQEGEYNLGRSLHQIGLTHLAVPYYERVLEISEKWEKRGGLEGDIKWEAAYNLQLIYFTSGNEAAAREVAEKWLVI
jgi:general transcription factor 3C polypeptide 3 (transcription factor C subunit 4)